MLKKENNGFKLISVLDENGDSFGKFNPYYIRKFLKKGLVEIVSTRPFIVKVKSNIDKNYLHLRGDSKSLPLKD